MGAVCPTLHPIDDAAASFPLRKSIGLSEDDDEGEGPAGTAVNSLGVAMPWPVGEKRERERGGNSIQCSPPPPPPR